jgi:hypothetical protein
MACRSQRRVTYRQREDTDKLESAVRRSQKEWPASREQGFSSCIPLHQTQVLTLMASS